MKVSMMWNLRRYPTNLFRAMLSQKLSDGRVLKKQHHMHEARSNEKVRMRPTLSVLTSRQLQFSLCLYVYLITLSLY